MSFTTVTPAGWRIMSATFFMPRPDMFPVTPLTTHTAELELAAGICPPPFSPDVASTMRPSERKPIPICMCMAGSGTVSIFKPGFFESCGHMVCASAEP